MAKESIYETAKHNSLLSAGPDYLELMYEQYLRDPNSVNDEWRQYFQQLPKANGAEEVSHQAIKQQFAALAKQGAVRFVATGTATASDAAIQIKAINLTQAYRAFGHRMSKMNPLNINPIPAFPLDAFNHSELDQTVMVDQFITPQTMALKQLQEKLKTLYCGPIGYEYLHITDITEQNWWKQHIERSNIKASPEQQQKILKQLVAAEGLEKYLGSKYVGQKRFSLEGGDSLIPLLQHVIETAAAESVQEIFIGMAHRGRLNVLVNVLGKAPNDLFQEFEGKLGSPNMSGDVKYHKGYSADIKLANHEMHLALAFNPSHLEIINPVVEGSTRARQKQIKDKHRNQVIPLLIHGDAAFAGQGVVYETMNFARTRGYSTGGTIHIVINNQIGFTTSCCEDARSTLYCTDIAKMLEIPVLHVNGDEPEAVVRAAELATLYRLAFNKDVIIDLVCYRRHGHNEADDPSITQPTMYDEIKKHQTVCELYAQKLMTALVIDQKTYESWIADYRNALDAGKVLVSMNANGKSKQMHNDWQPYINQHWRQNIPTNYDLKQLKQLANQLETIPQNFKLHPQVEKLITERKKMTAGEIPLNWGYAETLAYATLLNEKYLVRLSGQDCGRGTFSHRHAALYDCQNGQRYIPLTTINSEDPESFCVIDSILSEEGVLGFEYGYAAAEPKGLILWEAQFGDFVNGAQVVIDQFLTSGEQKWGRLCGLTMLLPHGYEGQGPEHTSARLERFLQLCAQDNIQICVPTTPAQCFHMLRRQVLRPYRKPLIVLTPKSLLRHKLAVSSLQDLSEGQFQPVISDPNATKNVDRVVFCSGKVYYDLWMKREELKQNNVALIRVEQLYPFPDEEIKAILNVYKNAKQIIWCQEEPQNQGAWFAIQPWLSQCLLKGQQLEYCGRPSAASPAVGSPKVHMEEQTALIQSVFK